MRFKHLVPAVSLNFKNNDANLPHLLSQCKQALTELITRDKNRPSVIAYSVCNEPIPQSWKPNLHTSPGASAQERDIEVTFMTSLIQHARSLDNTRLVTFASLEGGGLDSWFNLVDFICLNRYFGWYNLGGRLSQAKQVLAQDLEEVHSRHPNKPILLSEFGADTIAGAHALESEMFSEEYQVEMIKMYLDVAERPWVAGTHVWNLTDFKTSQGVNRVAGYNLKGVFTVLRRPKMAAHYLRARWNKEATTHVWKL